MNGQPLPVIQPYEQLHVPCFSLHPRCGKPDDGEYLLREGRQPCPGHNCYFLDPVCADHLDITIRVHEGHVVHTVRDGAHSLIAFDGLLRDPHALLCEFSIDLQLYQLLAQARPILIRMLIR